MGGGCFTVFPCEGGSSTVFSLCASLSNPYYHLMLWVQQRTEHRGRLCSLGGHSLVWETEAQDTTK